MIIDAYLTPYFPETENQFNDSYVIMIDVLRASTTVCAALFAGAKEIIPTDSLDKAVKIYSSLSKEMSFIGGERNGIKPSGFDAGNSPLEYHSDNVHGKNVIFTTTNGTKIFQKAKLAKARIVGSFVNITSVVNYILEKASILPDDSKPVRISIICAGNNGLLSYEDVLCAGAFINQFSNFVDDLIISDTADAARHLFLLHSNHLKSFIKTREHAKYLESLGFEDDLEVCLTFDVFPVVPLIKDNSIKLADETKSGMHENNL